MPGLAAAPSLALSVCLELSDERILGPRPANMRAGSEYPIKNCLKRE
jgi:hypothetical protein